MVCDTSIGLAEALDKICPHGIVSTVAMASVENVAADALEETACAGFSPSRRAEFLGGRNCARTALSKLGHSEASIGANDDGVPQWPLGILGSITHTKGLCGAVIAKTGDFRCLGLDFEQAGRLSEGAAKRVVHPLEADFAKSHPDAPTYLFSLKEAFYKAQYPKWQKRANFQDIALAVDLKKGNAEICYINKDLGEVAAQSGTHFHFHTTSVGRIIIALCWVPVTA